MSPIVTRYEWTGADVARLAGVEIPGDAPGAPFLERFPPERRPEGIACEAVALALLRRRVLVETDRAGAVRRAVLDVARDGLGLGAELGENTRGDVLIGSGSITFAVVELDASAFDAVIAWYQDEPKDEGDGA